VQQVRARRIAVMKFLCRVGEQFSATDLYRNAIAFRGHRFLCMAFRIQRNGGRASVYYCSCGEMSVRDESTGDFVGLTSDASVVRLASCRLTKLT
jgi:hypothetical protein